MEFVIEEPAEWLRALDKISKASRPTLNRASAEGPSRIRLWATANSIELLARDEYVVARTVAPAVIGLSGGCCVPLHFLRSVLSDDSVGPIAVRRLLNKILVLSAPGWRRQVATIDAEEIEGFPQLPDSWLTVPADILKLVLGIVKHAADADAQWGRPSSGIFLECASGRLKSSAADGYCAASASVPFTGDFPERLIIHQRSVREMIHAIGAQGNGDIAVSLLKSYFFVRTKDADVAVRALGLKWIDLSGVLGIAHSSRCVVARAALATSLRRICEVTSARQMNLWFNGGQLILSAEGDENRSAEDTLPAVCGGACGPIVVDPARLREAVSALQHVDEVVVEGGGPLEHLVLRAAGKAEATIVLTTMQAGM